METKDYREMAGKIQAELAALEIQQEEIERRIARLRQSLVGLIPLCELDADEDMPSALGIRDQIDSLSITDAVRQILQAAEKPLSPTQIKQQLINMGKDLSGQKNVMASIHSLLKRLVSSEEIESKDSGLTYQWKPRSILGRTEWSLGGYKTLESALTHAPKMKKRD